MGYASECRMHKMFRLGLVSEHAASSAADYKDQYGVYGFRVNKNGREWILESCAAMGMTVGNTLLKETHLIIEESLSSKTVVDCYVVRKDQRKILKDKEFYLIKNVSPNICDFNIRKVTDTKRRTLFPEERSENYMRAVSGVISAPMSRRGKRAVRLMRLKMGLK